MDDTRRLSNSPFIELRTKRIMVTGGSGFLGTYVVQELKERNCNNIFVTLHKDYDLVQMEAVKKAYQDFTPDIVIHLAGVVGGIGANQENPGKFFYDNLMMGIQLMEMGRQRGIEKFVALGTICAYPKFTPVPFKEEDLWNGYPEETIASYGLAKRVILGQTQAYRKQYNFNAIYLILVNLYGPGNNFDPKNSFVIPSLIKKIDDAKKQGLTSITLWGSGNASRDFLYVGDGAKAIIKAAERYDKPDPINIGSGSEIKIKTIANNIREIIGYNGEIIWDISKPEGRRSSLMDISKAKKEIDFIPETSFEVGLRKTIDWYKFNSN